MDNNSQDVKVDYISQSSEMIEIFNKYEFSIENLFSSDSANLIIFSSLPDDFMDIQPVVDRKNLFINTLIPIIYSENLRILSERKKYLIGGENQTERVSHEIFGLNGYLN